MGMAQNKLKDTLDQFQKGCQRFLTISRKTGTGLAMPGKTRLDKERIKQCRSELDGMRAQAGEWRQGVKRNTARELARGARGILDRLRHLTEDPQHTIPDIFVWLLSGNKRMAYLRIPSRNILYSATEEEIGNEC